VVVVTAKPVIRSVERTRRGFILHLADGAWELKVRPPGRRPVEFAFRALGVEVVDEWGARIDLSQFEKESDPAFNRKVGPGFWGFFVMAFFPLLYFWWQAKRGRATIV